MRGASSHLMLTTGAALVLLQAGPMAAQSSMSVGASAGVYLAGGTFGGTDASPAVWLEGRGLGSSGLRPEVGGMLAIGGEGSVTLGASVGGAYVIPSRRFSVGGGGAALVPLGSGNSDFWPGAYVGLTWVFARTGGAGVLLQAREYLVSYGGSSVRRLTLGIGVTQFPTGPPRL
ncbi:MAG TPA: hypothetical protein VD793_07990 [Gemmatimonadales bacterium]|nr:hypothetical protein [Gemmatimonadales bacterium]